jgi:hypothetical protein
MSIGGGEGYGERDRTDEEGMAYGRGPSQTTTRTHLPGSEGTGRPPARPGRSVITVVGIVVLLIAAIAFANRGGSGSDEDKANSADQNGGGPAAQPTAPTGKQPVRTGSGGIASDFPKTQQGAQSAAANYAVALGGDGMFRDSERTKIVKAVYAPNIAGKRARALNKVYSDPEFLKRIGLKSDGSAPSGATFVSRTNPVGTKVTSFNSSSAMVSVWYSSLFGLAGEGSKDPVGESWYTNTFDLKWVAGDWKVTDFNQKDGPTPVGHDQAASSAEKMADAVKGYGGFTYAR